MLEDIDGVLYTSDVPREDVEELTPILKEKMIDTIFARISVSMGRHDCIDFIVNDVITINNTDIYPKMIKFLKN